MKLIKTIDRYNLVSEQPQGKLLEATSSEKKLKSLTKYHITLPKLSKQNCDELFGIFDVNSEVEDIVKTICPDDRGKDIIYGTAMAVGIQCFNKAMELNKDKVFALDDMIMQVKAAFYNGVIVGKGNDPIFSIDDFVQSIRPIQDPTEIEVEIVMECLDPTCDGVNRKGCCIPGDKPKLDSSGNLILKKI